MNLVKGFFIVMLGLIGAMETSGQTVTTPDLNKSLIPPSPDAASLGKYGIVPVTLYQGSPNTSVPVYDIKTSRLSLPISLGYNYNGYTPGTEASWAGLGWTLQAQGVITRVVKGLVDGQATDMYGSYGNEWADYANILDMTDNDEFLNRVADRHVDPEPDLYIFNFNGHSGKFIMVGSRAFTFPHQDIQITRSGNGFKIVDESGNTYNFLTIEETHPTNNTNPGYYVPVYNSAWYLTSVTSADQTDQINFEYTDWSYHQYNNIVSETYNQQLGGTHNGANCGGMNCGCDTWTENQYQGGQIIAKRLTRIISKNCIVNFIPETTHRLDLNSPEAFALKEVQVFSLPDTVMIRKMELVHEYFAYNAVLKLKAVNLTGYYNTASNATLALPGYYTFDYANEASGEYPKSTKSIDKFGFLNGKNNPTLFEANFLGYNAMGPGPGDRSVDASKSINGILTKLTYPTGGYTEFNYETNILQVPGQPSYEQNLVTTLNVNYDGVHNPTTVQGIFNLNEAQTINITVVRTIPSWWVHNDQRILQIFRYVPASGDCNSFVGNGGPCVPAVYDSVYLSPRIGPSDTVGHFTLALDTGLYVYRVYCGSEAISAGGTINYKTLITPPQGVTQPGPGLRIKEIKSYDAVNLNVPAITKTYSYSPAIPISLDSYGFSTVQHDQGSGNTITGYDENIYTSSYSSPLASLIGNQFYYPKVTEVNHDIAGSGKTVYEYVADGFNALDVKLNVQSVYSYNAATSSNILLKKIINGYTARSGINFWGFTNNLKHVVEGSLPPLPSSPFDLIDRRKSYEAKPYAFTSYCLQLTSTLDSSFDQYGENPMVVNTDYYYDNINHLQPTRTVVLNSKGETITTQVKYPYDCAVSYTCGLPGFQYYGFRTKRDESSVTYQNCKSARYTNAIGLWSYSSNSANAGNQTLIGILNSYPCEANYPSQFASALGNIGSLPCPAQGGYTDNGVLAMQGNHIINTPVEQIVSINRGGQDYLFSATRTEFTTNGAFKVSPKTLYQTDLGSTSVLKSDYMNNPSAYLKARVSFVSDANNNIVEQNKTNDVKTAYIWDYKNMFAVAQCSNADKDNIAYTSFEADGKGRFSFTGTIVADATAPTGKKVYQLASGNSNEISINTDAGKLYTVSLWAKNNGVTVNNNAPTRTGRTINNWACYEYDVSSASTVTIRGTSLIDEVRLYPKDGLMTTYTFDPLIGQTSQCDPNNHTSYYEYDALGRLLLIRNEDRHIVKQYAYSYDQWNTETAANWVNTGLTRCKACPANNNYLSNILEQQQKDMNTNSPTYNQLRWVDAGPSVVCDANAGWENVSPAEFRCVVNGNNENTGEREQKQQDMNPCSVTYGQYRWLNIGTYLFVCPLPASCTDCTDSDKKCINSVCETGQKVYTSSVYYGKGGYWICTYHYHWSDNSNSSNYTENSASNCLGGGGGVDF